MNQCEITYFHSKAYKIEMVYCKDTKITYLEHNHVSNYVIGLVLDGKIQLTRSNEQMLINKNDFFIIPPYEPHMIEAFYGKYTMMTVCVNIGFVREYDLETAFPILQDLADSLLIKELITPEQRATFSRSIDLLFLSIISTKEPLREEILYARNYLEQIPENAISIDQLSQNFFISKYHFIREFKKAVGLTPHRFQIQNRIRKAQHLLTEKRSITEVALVTGFYDQSHFIKCFRKMVGITPSKYLLSNSELPL
ncbi:MAG: helix-turn-helix domain-containing protein [Lachnospiraceae bacterium]